MPQYLAPTKCLCRLKYLNSFSATWPLLLLNALIPGCPVQDSPSQTSSISTRSAVPAHKPSSQPGLFLLTFPQRKRGREIHRALTWKFSPFSQAAVWDSALLHKVWVSWAQAQRLQKIGEARTICVAVGKASCTSREDSLVWLLWGSPLSCKQLFTQFL